MKLFLISQEHNTGYDTYDSAVVVAPDEETAKQIHPGDIESPNYNLLGAWCSDPEYVTAQYLGEAAEGIEQGVVCASYNAG
jgi:hypothetical protein